VAALAARTKTSRNSKKNSAATKEDGVTCRTTRAEKEQWQQPDECALLTFDVTGGLQIQLSPNPN
jgi:hypothetical protein